MSEAQVRHQLALQDTLDSETTQQSFEISPSALISQGLELEELQYVCVSFLPQLLDSILDPVYVMT